jgi:hypothetical protein
LLLKLEHHFSKIIYCFGRTPASLTDLPIDTKNTSQTTIAEKNRSGSSFANQRSFFSEMWVKGRDLELGIGLTKSFFAVEPVSATLSGTQLTAFHNIPQFLTNLFQLTVSMQSDIGWLEIRNDLWLPSSGERILTVFKGFSRTLHSRTFSSIGECIKNGSAHP